MKIGVGIFSKLIHNIPVYYGIFIYIFTPSFVHIIKCFTI